MRFLSSRCRTAAEILLTLAVLAYVTYDLVDRSGGRQAASSGVVPQPAAAAAAAATSLHSQHSAATATTTTSAVALNKLPSARFEALVDPTITDNNTFPVCGATPAPTDPWQIGGTGNKQALIFLGNANCPNTPAVMGSNNLTYAGVHVLANSWLSLQNILPTMSKQGYQANAGAVGALAMDANSYLEAVFPANFVPSPYIVQVLNLLRSSSACPSFAGVNFTVPNCISAPSVVGNYVCVLSATPNQPTCTISLTIVGRFSAQASNYIAATLDRDCSTMTVVTFKQTIELIVGVPFGAQLVTYWQCGSIVVFFTVLGASTAEANVALNLIYTSMLTGALRSALSVISVSIVGFANPAANSTYVTSTINYPYSYPYILPYLVPYSQSNPALLALLTLLLIPVAIALALLLWCACRPVRKPVPPPCPCPCPCPAPCPYMPLPTCMPAPCPPPVVCEPMCAPLMSSGLGSPAAPCPAF